MIARPIGVSWQTMLADLSLILFMVTAAALADAPDAPDAPDVPGKAAAPAPHQPPPRVVPPAPPAPAPALPGAPVGVWRPAAGGPTLPQWLDSLARDPRLRLTITLHYRPGGRAAALARAVRLDQTLGPRGHGARIVIEPGRDAGADAVVGYDADPPDLTVGTQFAGKGA